MAKDSQSSPAWRRSHKHQLRRSIWKEIYQEIMILCHLVIFWQAKKNSCAINWYRCIYCQPPGHPSRTTSAYSNWSPPGVRSVPAERGESGVTRQPPIPFTTIGPPAFDTSFETKENQHGYFFCWEEMPIGCQGYMKTLEIWWKIPTRLQRQNPSPYLPYPQTLMVRRVELKAILVKVQSSSPVIASVRRS